jgi:hypothetical protein
MTCAFVFTESGAVSPPGPSAAPHWFRERKGTQEHAIEHAEDCRVASDAQREGHHGDHGEHLGFAQLTRRELQIFYQTQGATAAVDYGL